MSHRHGGKSKAKKLQQRRTRHALNSSSNFFSHIGSHKLHSILYGDGISKKQLKEHV